MNFAGNSNLELDLKIKKIKLELQYQKLKNHGIDPKYCTKSVSVKIVQILNHKIQSPVLDSTHWCPLEFDIFRDSTNHLPNRDPIQHAKVHPQHHQ